MQLLRRLRLLTVTMVDSILPGFVITYSGVRAVSFDGRTIDALTSKRTNQPGSEKPKEKEKEKVEEKTTATHPTVCHVNVFPSVTTIANSKDSSARVTEKEDQTATASSTPTKDSEKNGGNTAAVAASNGGGVLGLFSRPQAPQAKALPPPICKHVLDFYYDCLHVASEKKCEGYINLTEKCHQMGPTSADISNVSDDRQNSTLHPPAELLHMSYHGLVRHRLMVLLGFVITYSGVCAVSFDAVSYGVASAIALRTIDALASKQPNPSVCHVDFPSVTTITNSKDSSTLVISTKKEDQTAAAAAAISTPTKVREKSGLFSRPQAPKAKALPLICEHVFDFYNDCAHTSEKKCEGYINLTKKCYQMEIQNTQAASPQGQSDSNLTQGTTSADISKVSDDGQNPPLRAPAELLLLSYHGERKLSVRPHLI
ncbi:hypothetical protein RHGRI_022455 [Rhododendron griersonianum]|uniref:CHCH domain-containing protein n=1 Tax=Rhododendron griersonianum TaxID=479676 RepID=A0AAV6J579_9ERIC|nr:hypothetical protein RHGRI_022455 [Rhododendron griersonianum]